MNPNYRVVPNTAGARRRYLTFESKATIGNQHQLTLAAAAVPRQPTTSHSLALLLAFLGFHVVLGLSMKELPILATVHAWLSFIVALYWAASEKAPGKVVLAVCYLAGAEVLWRMTGAAILWEFGKYSVCAVLLVWVLRHFPRRVNGLALVYFGLLLPSTLLTIQAGLGLSQLRQVLSFNLSGPFSLALCTFCFYGLRLSYFEAAKALLAILGPVIGAAAICLSGTASLGADYEFGDQSNFDTSGGFGPNQVSSVLGLGMLVVFLWMQRQQRMSFRWWLAVALILFFAAQASLTFSRTGIWIGVLTIGVASLFIIRRAGKGAIWLISALLILASCYLALFGSLNTFTGGKLSDRYSEKMLLEKGFTGRGDIAEGDLLLALHNPLFGVGPGMASFERSNHRGIAAHTEFTRLMAEHGLTGLLALGAILMMAASKLKAASSTWQQAWTASFIVYSLLFMMVTGMRLAVPSLAMGLAMARLTGADAGDPNHRIQAKRLGGGCYKQRTQTGTWLQTNPE